MPGDAVSIQELLRALRADNEPARAEAIEALGRRRVRKAYPEILAATGDASATVRWLAAALIGDRRLRGGADALIARLDDEDEEVRTRAAEGLGRLLELRAFPW